ncbi:MULTISPECIES: nucleotidyltransferase domain-containing protein [unclassified Streptomyces]|uniref:nucleotidyltransferase domain-containing protein n=1 Tax=unclassified Streptomyces TaxID=2593676 RepID=UPI000CD4D4EF|nr:MULTISPECIES: nucleotidyltransferase domain-containing protein [unclassified Streptomyces]
MTTRTDQGDDSGDRGLDPDGHIRREGSTARVTSAFAPLVADVRQSVNERFGPPGAGRLDGVHLYGSVPRGTAVPGVSDLDLLLALRREPSAADRADARALEAGLDARHEVIDGVGVLLFSTARLLSPAERHDLGFLVACLATPLAGEDLTPRLPRYRPTSELARGTNGDLALVLPRWRTRMAGAHTEDARRAISRTAARRLVRTAFTLVMPRWGGWTSDLERSAAVFAAHYPGQPERAAQVRLAARTARAPSADPALFRVLVDDLGPWLVAEYATVHGVGPGGTPPPPV